MKREHTLLLAVITALLVLLALQVVVSAQTSTSYNLEWHVIGGGGHPVSSTNYIVNGTIGQMIAGPPYVAGTNYVVSGGYWFSATLYRVYLPVVLKAP